MLDLSPAPGDLEPIETASRDEITALQLERLRWTLRHAYDNVPFYRRRFDEAGVHPDDCRELADLGSIPSPSSRTSGTTIRSGCWRCRGSR